MQEAGSKAALAGGIGPKTYAAAVLVLVLLGVAMAGLLLRALSTGEWMGALFLVGFAGLFTWQVGGFVKRNRPRSYSFDHLPEALLP
jgi:Flp pilus assembly protein TadB